MTLDEKVAKKLLKIARQFVDHDDYDELKAAIMKATPSGEGQGKSTALICHGRLLQARDIFALLEETARPPAEPEKKRGDRRPGVDPDLDAD